MKLLPQAYWNCRNTEPTGRQTNYKFLCRGFYIYSFSYFLPKRAVLVNRAAFLLQFISIKIVSFVISVNFANTISGGDILDSNFYGYPLALGLLFDNDSASEEYFLSLPEETQKALISEDIHSADDLHDCVERLKMKE